MPPAKPLTRTPWRLRKDGSERCTVRVELHVPRELCSFIRKNEGLGEIEALFVIKDIARELDTWHVLIYNNNNERLILHVDDLGWFEKDWPEAAIYNGPSLAWS